MNTSVLLHHSAASRLLFYSFLMLCFWLPLPLGSNRVWAWSMMEFWVFSLGALWCVAYYFDQVHIPKAFWKARWWLGMFLLIPLWSFLQSLPLSFHVLEWLSPSAVEVYKNAGLSQGALSLDPVSSKIFAVKSLAIIVGAYLTLLLINTEHRLRQFIMVIVASGVFQAVYGALMTLSGLEYGFFIEKEHYRGVATGTFINRNHLAGYLEMCLALGIGLMLAESVVHHGKNWRAKARSMAQILLSRKIRLRLFLAIMVIALVLTKSRMGNTAFFLSLSLGGILYLYIGYKRYLAGRQTHPVSRSAGILFVSLLVVDVFIVGAWFGIDRVVDRVENTSFASENRDEINKYALLMIADYWKTGTGGGSFYSSFPAYKGLDIGMSYDHAHNDYLQFTLELGLPMMTLTAILVLSVVMLALRVMWIRRNLLFTGCAFAVVMGVTSILLHSFVDFNLQIPANGFLFMQLLCLPWICLYLNDNHFHKR